MQDPCDIQVFEFEWDEVNEPHCARHDLTPVTVQEVKDSRPKFFLNDPGKTGTHIMIGPDSMGRYWTIVIKPGGKAGLWWPVTGWPSERDEIMKYMKYNS